MDLDNSNHSIGPTIQRVIGGSHAADQEEIVTEGSGGQADEALNERVRTLADQLEPLIPGPSSAPIGEARTLTEAVARTILAGIGPLRVAFLARALNAIADLTAQLDESKLGNAIGASSDYDVIVHALESPEALPALRQGDPLAAARLRGLLARSRILEADGGPFTVDQVAKSLGISRQAVDKRRRAGKLLGLDTGRRGYLYPSWQFTSDGVLPGLETVLRNLTIHDPWMQAAFFLNGSYYLDGESPLAELRRGHVKAVVRAALTYGEQGAA
jgi:hypothetical protein